MSIGDTPRTDSAIRGASMKHIADSYFIELTNLARTLERDLARLTEEKEALRKDAERFRFLKRVYFDIKMSAFQLIGPTSTPEELDATIDAAIKEGS